MLQTPAAGGPVQAGAWPGQGCLSMDSSASVSKSNGGSKEYRPVMIGLRADTIKNIFFSKYLFFGNFLGRFGMKFLCLLYLLSNFYIFRLLKVNPRHSDFPVESCQAYSSTPVQPQTCTPSTSNTLLFLLVLQHIHRHIAFKSYQSVHKCIPLLDLLRELLTLSSTNKHPCLLGVY